MAPALTLGGLSLTNGPYDVADSGIDFGGADLMATIYGAGDLRPEEIDQYLEEQRYVRSIVIPLRVGGGSPSAVVANAQAVIQKVTAANRFNPVALTFQPSGGNLSTFYVIGGSLVVTHDALSEMIGLYKDAELRLSCKPFCYGTPQNLGSAGAPLVSNATSPANATLTLSPTGDVPADVTLFVKNRSASAIRSLMVAAVGGNTSWTAGVAASTWTLDADGVAVTGSQVGATASVLNVVMKVAHFASPPLPSDRRFRVYLSGGHGLQGLPSNIEFRVRVVSGQTEIVGPWRAYPQEWATPFGVPPLKTAAADMGAYNFPVGEVGQLGAQSTTVFVEAVQTSGAPPPGNTVTFASALFVPDDALLTVETSDTSKTLAAAAATVRVENDQVYDSSGNPAGGVVVGGHIRTTGGRYMVYTSQGYMGSLDLTLPWSPEAVDVYATATPRYIHLA